MFTATQLIGFMAGGDDPIITSIQQCTITIAAGATEGEASALSPAVTLALASEHFLGFITDNTSSTSQHEYRPRIKLVDDGGTIKLKAYRNTSDATFTVTVKAAVIAWHTRAISSIVRGEVALASTVTSATDTVSVTKDNSAIFYLGETCDSTTSSVYARSTTNIQLTDDSTVTARRDTGTGATDTGYVLVNFNSGILDGVVQHFVVTVASAGATGTATITAIDTARTMLGFGGCSSASSNDNGGRMAYIALTATDTVTGTKTLTSGGDAILYGCAIQFKSQDILSIERDVITIAGGATTGDDTITAVTVAKTLPNYLGLTTGSNSTVPEVNAHLHLESTTVMRATRNTLDASLTVSVSHEAVQFRF